MRFDPCERCVLAQCSVLAETADYGTSSRRGPEPWPATASPLAAIRRRVTDPHMALPPLQLVKRDADLAAKGQRPLMLAEMAMRRGTRR